MKEGKVEKERFRRSRLDPALAFDLSRARLDVRAQSGSECGDGGRVSSNALSRFEGLEQGRRCRSRPRSRRSEW